MRHCLAVDLKDDPASIEEYIAQHRHVWPAVLQSLHDAGVQNMQIYLAGNRLFMVLEVDDTFTFERKAAMDAANEHVQAWETMMGKLIQAIPSAKPGARWIPMQRVFELSSASAATLPSHSLRV